MFSLSFITNMVKVICSSALLANGVTYSIMALKNTYHKFDCSMQMYYTTGRRLLIDKILGEMDFSLSNSP